MLLFEVNLPRYYLFWVHKIDILSAPWEAWCIWFIVQVVVKKLVNLQVYWRINVLRLKHTIVENVTITSK